MWCLIRIVPGARAPRRRLRVVVSYCVGVCVHPVRTECLGVFGCVVATIYGPFFVGALVREREQW